MTYKLRIGSSIQLNRVQDELQKNFQWLKEHGCTLSIKTEQIGKYHYLMISLQSPWRSPLFRQEDMVFIFKYQLAEVLAENIMTVWEDELVRRRLERNYRSLSENEKQVVYGKALDFLKKCNNNESLNLLMRFGRKNKIAHRIFEHLDHNDLLVVDGFINFCLRDYLTEIKFAIELACEEVRNEREYNEFIKLLRYFVDSQVPRVLEVNLLIKDSGLFNIWDGEGNFIDEKYVNYYLDDILVNNVNVDDVLVSILITIAPRRVILHSFGKIPDTESMRVIRKVFRDKILTCRGCERCMENQVNKHDG